MRSRLQLDRSALYTGAIVATGALVIARSLLALYTQPISSAWLAIAALTLICSSAAIRVPTVPATISASETFLISSMLLFGTPAGAVTAALDTLVVSFW